MPTVRQLSSTDSRPSRTRSAVTNGRRAFVDGDGNSAWYRRRKDIVELHLDDMGGRDALSEAQISLACRAASIEVELEQMEGRLSKGEPVDLDAFTRAAGHLRRILETLGVERRKGTSPHPLRISSPSTRKGPRREPGDHDPAGDVGSASVRRRVQGCGQLGGLARLPGGAVRLGVGLRPKPRRFAPAPGALRLLEPPSPKLGLFAVDAAASRSSWRWWLFSSPASATIALTLVRASVRQSW